MKGVTDEREEARSHGGDLRGHGTGCEPPPGQVGQWLGVPPGQIGHVVGVPPGHWDKPWKWFR